MPITRQILPLLGLSAVLLPLWNCASSPHSPDEKYYFVASNVKLPYWQTAGNGLIKAAQQIGVKAEMVGPDTYDVQGEKQEFERIAKLKPTGILVSAAVATALTPDINSAIDAGVPVIAVDADAPGSKRLLFIGTNSYQAGQIGGRLAVKQMNGRGNFVVYTMPGQANLDERLKGYKDAFLDHPQMKIIDVVDIKGDPRVAFDHTMDLVQKSKDKVDGFICLEAQAGKEVAEVLSRNNVTGKTVIAMDTDEGTLDAVQKGVIAATIAQKPFTMGYYGLMMLDDLHHRKLQPLDRNWSEDPFSLVPSFVDTGATVVDKSNVDAYLKARDASKNNSQ